jgi:RimJ/RimL family protein N-acetyltransferase
MDPQQQEVKIEVRRLNSSSPFFTEQFEPFRPAFLEISRNAYSSYYGDDYQIRRLHESPCDIYLAIHEHRLIGFSYVKQNARRGGTAVYPQEYRRLGIANKLTKESLKFTPHQYSIVLSTNKRMIALLLKNGFRYAENADDLRLVLKEDFTAICDMRQEGGIAVFCRRSSRRNATRENLVLLHTYP